MPQPAVRLGSPCELALALPLLLGYQPTDSLVVCCLTGDGGAVGLTLRFDLAGLESTALWVDELADRVALAGAAALFVVVYSEAADCDGALPHTDLVDELLDQLGFMVREALLVREGRWWSYFCSGMGCCPPEGTALEIDSQALTSLKASMVLAGSAVLVDRKAVVASIAADATADTAVQRRRVTLARRRVERMRPDDRRAEVARLVAELTSRLADPRGEVTDAEAALLAALCCDIGARDDLLLLAGPTAARAELLALLRVAVRRVPPPNDAPLCTVLAWFAYATGDGTLVNIALDRALRSDPYYSLARLVESSIDRQIPPTVIDEVVSGAARDIAERDTAR